MQYPSLNSKKYSQEKVCPNWSLRTKSLYQSNSTYTGDYRYLYSVVSKSIKMPPCFVTLFIPFNLCLIHTSPRSL